MPEGYLQPRDDEAAKRAPDPTLPAMRAWLPELPPEFDTDSLPNALFGFDKYSVIKLLEQIRGRFLQLWQETAEREERIKNLELELHRSREAQRLVGETLLVARQQAQTMREEARRSATSLMKTARKRAEEIEAVSEHNATVKARELIDTAEHERKVLLDEAGKARAFVEQTHEQLSDFLLAAVKWYEQTKLVGEEQARPEPAPSTNNVPEGPQDDASSVETGADARVAENA